MKKLTANQIILSFKVVAILLLGSILVFVSLSNKPQPESDIILVNYADEDNYYLFKGDVYQHIYEVDSWEHKDNGLQTSGDPYDYILMEDHIIFYTNRDITQIEILEGNAGQIEFLNNVQFIYWADNELPDHLVLEITY